MSYLTQIVHPRGWKTSDQSRVNRLADSVVDPVDETVEYKARPVNAEKLSR
jgi:hypothetical protein